MRAKWGGGEVGSDESPDDLEDFVVSLAVPPQLHSDLTVVEDMRKGPSGLLTKATDIAVLFAPEMEVGIGRESV